MRIRMGAIGETFDRIDVIFDRRCASRPGAVLLAELFLGIGWLRSGIAKVTEPEWWSGHELANFVAEHETATIEWYRPVIDLLVVDNAVWWAAVVLVLELLIGLALLAAIRTGTGLAAAIFLNLNFLLIGASNPSVFYLVLQFGLVLWLLETSSAPSRSTRKLRVITVAGLVLAAVSLPYMRTLDPALIIDDPAATLCTWAFFGALAAAATRRRIRRQVFRAPVIDLRDPAASATHGSSVSSGQ